jgi:hypothetical protein
MCKEAVVSQCILPPCLEEMKKATKKKIRHYSRSAGRNLNPRSTEYDAVLSSYSPHTVYWVCNSADERVQVGSGYKLPKSGGLQGGSGPGLCCHFLSFSVVSVFVDGTN